MSETSPYMNGSSNTHITKALTSVLADMFVLYFKTHAYHWNVVGPHFKALHDLFGEQYTELWTAIDEVAERIRALGAPAPLSVAHMIKESNLQETGQCPDDLGMIQALLSDHRRIVETLYTALRIAQDSSDEATVDLLIGRIHIHEKSAWMLESLSRR